MKKKASLICDLQFGSTGKGLIAGYLAEKNKPDVLVTAWSMNAGHTYIDGDNKKFVHCMLANGIVSPRLKYVLIGPGSQIGLDKLFAEMEECRGYLFSADVLIHPHACIIQQRHIDEEQGSMGKIGSTQKGCGAALIEKIKRNPDSKITAKNFAHYIGIEAASRKLRLKVCSHEEYLNVLHEADQIQIEGAQGYSLGINSGLYPFCTSRECTPAQILSDCAVPIKMLNEVVGTMRTYPIRVANRRDQSGNMVGWSGPCYPDQYEISFEEIKQETELTTVTKLPRRIFTFSKEQARQAIQACTPDKIFLNFANYVKDETELFNIVHTINSVSFEYGAGYVKYLGYGPRVNDIKILEE